MQAIRSRNRTNDVQTRWAGMRRAKMKLLALVAAVVTLLPMFAVVDASPASAAATDLQVSFNVSHNHSGRVEVTGTSYHTGTGNRVAAPVRFWIDGGGRKVPTVNGYTTGFSFRWPNRTSGWHQVCGKARNSNGQWADIGCKNIQVRFRPQGSITSVSANIAGRVSVSGWASDKDTTDAVRIVVKANGKYLGDTYTDSRYTAFSSSFAVPAGNQRICITAMGQTSYGEPNKSLGCRDVSVKAPVEADIYGEEKVTQSVTGKRFEVSVGWSSTEKHGALVNLTAVSDSLGGTFADWKLCVDANHGREECSNWMTRNGSRVVMHVNGRSDGRRTDTFRIRISARCGSHTPCSGGASGSFSFEVTPQGARVTNQVTNSTGTADTTSIISTAPSGVGEFVEIAGYTHEAWILRSDGTRQWIDGSCRAQLIAAVGAPRQANWNSELAHRADTSGGARLTCAQLVSGLGGSSTPSTPNTASIPPSSSGGDVVLLKHANASDAHMVYPGEGVRRWVDAGCLVQIQSAGLRVDGFTNWNTEVAIYPGVGTKSCAQYIADLGGSSSTSTPSNPPSSSGGDVVLLKHANASDAHMVYPGEGVRRWVDAGCLVQIQSAGLRVDGFTNWNTEVAIYPAGNTLSCAQYLADMGG